MVKRYAVKMPQELRTLLLRDLPVGEQAVVSARVLHVDLDGYCWLDDRVPAHYTDEARIHRILISKEKDGYVCDLSPSRGHYLWHPEDIPPDHRLVPVIRLEGL